MREDAKLVAAGMNPMDLKRGVDLAVAEAVKDIAKRSKKIKDSAEVAQVGSIAANGDKSIGKMIADAMQKVGNEGVITVEEAKSLETELDVVEGMQFCILLAISSPYCITNHEKMVAELEDPYILIHEKKLSSLQPMRAGSRGGRADARSRSSVIAEDNIEGEALATLVVDELRGGLKVAAVKAARLRRPAQGDARGRCDPHRRHDDRRGPRHQARERRRLQTLGKAKRVRIEKENATIINGAGKEAPTSRDASPRSRRRSRRTTSGYRTRRSCRSVSGRSSPAASR